MWGWNDAGEKNFIDHYLRRHCGGHGGGKILPGSDICTLSCDVIRDDTPIFISARIIKNIRCCNYEMIIFGSKKQPSICIIPSVKRRLP